MDEEQKLITIPFLIWGISFAICFFYAWFIPIEYLMPYAIIVGIVFGLSSAGVDYFERKSGDIY